MCRTQRYTLQGFGIEGLMSINSSLRLLKRSRFQNVRYKAHRLLGLQVNLGRLKGLGPKFEDTVSRMQSLMLKFGEAGMEGDIVKANDSWAPCLIAKARLLLIIVCAFWILCGSPFGHLKSSSSSSVAYQGRLQNSCNSRPVRRRTESFSKVTPTA